MFHPEEVPVTRVQPTDVATGREVEIVVDEVDYTGPLLTVPQRLEALLVQVTEQETLVEKMKPHVAEAEEHGVTIAIENHGNQLIYSLDSLRYLAEFAPSERLGIALAPYHLPQDSKAIADLIRDLGPKMVHFYAWEHGMGCMEKLPKVQEMKQLPGYHHLD